MATSLSQDEIDKIVGYTDLSRLNEQIGDEPKPFDITGQQKIIMGKIPAMDIVNDRFARGYQRILTNYLSLSVSINTFDVKKMKMHEYLSDLIQPTSLNICKLAPFDTASITIVMEAQLIYSILNTLYGGKESYTYGVEGKDFHAIEKDFSMNLLAGMFKEYEQAWEPIEKVSLSHVYTDTTPKTSSSPNETVYVSKMSVSFDGGGGDIYFCIPFGVMAPHIDYLEEKVKAFQGGVGVSWKSILLSETLDSTVGVDCVIAESLITMEELSKAEVGDIIPITYYDHSVLTINKYPAFVGDLCEAENNSIGLKITGALKHPSFRSKSQ